MEKKQLSIKNINGKIIFECHAVNMRDALQQAIKNKIRLWNAYLPNLDLSNMDLQFANLEGVILNNSNLYNANLTYAKLNGADLSWVNLCNANLSYTSLNYTNLKYSSILNANLEHTDFRMADLRCASIRYSSLNTVNLSGVILNTTTLDKRIIQVACIGSRKDLTTYCFDTDRIWCGCFIGTLDEFELKCIKTHKNNQKLLNEYIGFINYIKTLK